VKEDHIFHAPLCTACHYRTFFSYRKSKGKKTGRMMALIMLQEEA
jgi:copper oxidase (laccase) domain-containing protein